MALPERGIQEPKTRGKAIEASDDVGTGDDVVRMLAVSAVTERLPSQRHAADRTASS